MRATLSRPGRAGLTLGASLSTSFDPYLAPDRLDYGRQVSVRVALLPTVGLVARPGPRDRWDLFGGLQVGPEMLYSTLQVSNERVQVDERRTVVSVVANLEGGMRYRFTERVGGSLALTVPLAPGLANSSVPIVERLALGFGVTFSPGG